MDFTDLSIAIAAEDAQDQTIADIEEANRAEKRPNGGPPRNSSSMERLTAGGSSSGLELPKTGEPRRNSVSILKVPSSEPSGHRDDAKRQGVSFDPEASIEEHEAERRKRPKIKLEHYYEQCGIAECDDNGPVQLGRRRYYINLGVGVLRVNCRYEIEIPFNLNDVSSSIEAINTIKKNKHVEFKGLAPVRNSVGEELRFICTLEAHTRGQLSENLLLKVKTKTKMAHSIELSLTFEARVTDVIDIYSKPWLPEGVTAIGSIGRQNVGLKSPSKSSATATRSTASYHSSADRASSPLLRSPSPDASTS